MQRTCLFGLALLACAPGRAPEAARPSGPAEVKAEAAGVAEVEPRAGHFVIRGAEIVGVGVADLEVKDGRIAAIGAVPAGPPELRRVGGPASLIIVAADPQVTPAALAEPEAVVIAGALR